MVKIWMVITQALMALSVLGWAAAALMSPMAFDNGPSRAATVFVSALAAYPVLLLACVLMSWRCFGAGSGRAAAIWTSIPVVLVAAGALALQIHG